MRYSFGVGRAWQRYPLRSELRELKKAMDVGSAKQDEMRRYIALLEYNVRGCRDRATTPKQVDSQRSTLETNAEHIRTLLCVSGATSV